VLPRVGPSTGGECLTYSLARWDGDFLSQVDWLGVVLDEAQNIKNANTKQAQVIRALPADFRLALTGTPVENRVSELWSIMHFLNPGFLGGQKTFRRDFVLPIEKYGDEEAAERLRRLTRPFILRRVKTDPTVIRDLPDKQEMKAYCYLSEEQATLYEAVVRDGLVLIYDLKPVPLSFRQKTSGDTFVILSDDLRCRRSSTAQRVR
jgi:SNF2 family DNA or RNA helicase